VENMSAHEAVTFSRSYLQTQAQVD
jgi:hypothetical protein